MAYQNSKIPSAGALKFWLHIGLGIETMENFEKLNLWPERDGFFFSKIGLKELRIRLVDTTHAAITAPEISHINLDPLTNSLLRKH